MAMTGATERERVGHIKAPCRNNAAKTRIRPSSRRRLRRFERSPSAPPPRLLSTATAPSWLQTLRVYLEPASLRMLALGFSAGLPLLLVLGTLTFRLREAGIDRSTIGYLSWVGLAYGFKWVWSPLVDRLPIPLLTRWLGRRRSWLLLSQCLMVAGWWAWPLSDPRRRAGPHRLVRAGGGLWLGHAGHCARCLSHRIGRRRPPGGAGRRRTRRVTGWP